MDTLNNFKQPDKFKEQLSKFIVDNNIIGTAAGVSIAIVTKDIIQSFIGDILMPSFYFLLIQLNFKLITISKDKSILNVSGFFKQFISWILVIIITFLFVRIAFKLLFGVDDTTKLDTTAVQASAIAAKPPVKKETFIGGYSF